MSTIFEQVKTNTEARATLMKINSFMLNKRNSIILEETGKNEMTYCFEANVTQIGYRFSDSLRAALMKLDAGTMIIVYNDTIEALKREKGAHVDHSNFIFPGFPNETRMKDLSTLSNLRFAGYLADLLELTLNDEFHSSLGLGKYAEHPERTPLQIDLDELIELKVSSLEDFYQVISNLIGSRMALSSYDKEMVEFALKNEFLDNAKMIPEIIPFKETWAWLLKFDLENNLGLNIEFKNFLDFKRAYAGLIGADVSLSQKFRLTNLTNQGRLYLLSKLEEACIKYPKFVSESMYKEVEFVKLINNRLHPTKGKTAKRFPTVANMFIRILSGEKFVTDNAKIEGLLAEGKGYEAMKIAILNPGDAIRRLAFALSLETIENQKKILELVSQKADSVDLSVLLATKAYFDSCNESNIRVAMPKGNAKKSVIFVDKKELSVETCKMTSEMLEKAIISRLSNKATLGNVFVDEVLKDYNVPFATGTESKSLRTVARGSKIAFDKKAEVLRAFVYKKIAHGGFVDLSAAFLNEDFQFVQQCSWTNLKTSNNSKPLAMHSGDGYNCQNGLTEFIDIDLSVLDELSLSKNIRYVAFEVLSYNHIPFSNMDECFFGVMGRKSMFNDKIGDVDGYHGKFYHMLSEKEQAEIDFQGEVFEPSTVQYRFDLTGPEQVCMPLLYDVKERKFIWVDLAVRTNAFVPTTNNTVALTSGNVIPTSGTLCIENLQNGAMAACYSAVYMQKANLYDLFCANVRARGGNLVSSKEDADIVCSLDGDVTPFYRDIITKEWM